MSSFRTSIYENEEVIYTLAWLSDCKLEMSPLRIIRRSIQVGLVNINENGDWKVNERIVFRRLSLPKVVYPHFSETKKLAKLLLGLGEISARSHGDFLDIACKRFRTHFYRLVLPKVFKTILETTCFEKRKRTLEELGYSQQIGKTNFDWEGYERALKELNYHSRVSMNNYGLDFVIKLCLKVIPSHFSMIVEKHKKRVIVGDLCSPLITPLMFRDQQFITPLLKSKNAYLKLLASAAVVQDGPFGNHSTIDENIKVLVINGADVGDAIWQSSVKLRDHYYNVESLEERIKSTQCELQRCEEEPSICPKGVNPKQWISSRQSDLNRHQESFIKAKEKLKNSLSDIAGHWPKDGLTQEQIINFSKLIRSEKLSRQLVELIPTQDNQIYMLNDVLASVKNWIGISSQSTLGVCEEAFSYSSQYDLEKLVNAAKILLLLSNIKGQVIGKLLGNTVAAAVEPLESFSCSPYMNVRKPNQWQSATSRLACIHLLAMCVFDETPENKDDQISKILPIVVNKVNLLLKVQNAPLYLGSDELFRDLKRVTASVVSKKKNMELSAEAIVHDAELPADYRARVIVTNEALIREHGNLLLELFEDFSKPSIYVDRDYKNFSERVCLLDICIAHCWKFEAIQEAQKIIQIWEQSCSLYGDEFINFIDYAQKLYRALLQDGDEREWLKKVNGFEQSNCMNFLNKTLIQID